MALPHSATVPCVGLKCVIVVLSDHTLLFVCMFFLYLYLAVNMYICFHIFVNFLSAYDNVCLFVCTHAKNDYVCTNCVSRT